MNKGTFKEEVRRYKELTKGGLCQEVWGYRLEEIVGHICSTQAVQPIRSIRAI